MINCRNLARRTPLTHLPPPPSPPNTYVGPLSETISLGPAEQQIICKSHLAGCLSGEGRSGPAWRSGDGVRGARGPIGGRGGGRNDEWSHVSYIRRTPTYIPSMQAAGSLGHA